MHMSVKCLAQGHTVQLGARKPNHPIPVDHPDHFSVELATHASSLASIFAVETTEYRALAPTDTAARTTN